MLSFVQRLTRERRGRLRKKFEFVINLQKTLGIEIALADEIIE
jgi:hypothetical protein